MLRFAPSPTSDMNIGDLQVALFNFIVAKQNSKQFIVRIEDRDKEKNIEGKDEEILLILEKFALPYDQRFNQSENLHIHQTLAIRLLEEKKAFICICKNNLDCICSNSSTNLAKLKEDKTPFVIRIQEPKEDSKVLLKLGSGALAPPLDEAKAIVSDEFCKMSSFIILQANGIPTHNFACACDDMLTGVDFIIRGEEHIRNTPKQIYIKNLLGYDVATKYVHLPTILNGDDISVKWLFEEGFIPDAILNYLVQLGNKTPKDIFTLPDALEWFDLDNISKSPIEFDIDRLRFISREHLKLMDDKKLSKLFGFADVNIGKLAKVYLEEVSTTNELETKIKAIFSPKDFDGECGEQMRIISDLIADAPAYNDFYSFIEFISKESGLAEEKLLKPLRYLLTGSSSSPELSKIYPYIKSYILEIAS